MNITGRVVDVYVYRISVTGQQEFLLLHRAVGSMYAGQWRMIGGKIQEGETAWQAALRELKEETGLDPLVLWTVPSLNQFYEWREDRINLIPVFAAAVEGDPTLNHEHDTYEWMAADETAGRFCWPEHIRLISLIRSMLEASIPPELIVPGIMR